MKLTDNNFQAAISSTDSLIAVLVAMEWNGSSYLMKTMIERVEDYFCDRIIFHEMDHIQSEKTLATYGIENSPAFMLFSRGELIDKITDLVSRSELLSKINDSLQTHYKV